jgi:hypothetical protein
VSSLFKYPENGLGIASTCSYVKTIEWMLQKAPKINIVIIAMHLKAEMP